MTDPVTGAAPHTRHLADSPAVLFIVYTPGPGAEERGYEPWLVRIDNPFFNTIPGILHYANWKIERVLAGDPLPYVWFDFQGLVAEEDLERVWFNPDLDAFRTEWVRLWGYGGGKPPAVQANAYLMRPLPTRSARSGRLARITGGTGTPPAGADVTWRFEETIRKHFTLGHGVARWRVPLAEDNPLGLDWLAITYGDDADRLAAEHVDASATVAFVARLVAAP